MAQLKSAIIHTILSISQQVLVNNLVHLQCQHQVDLLLVAAVLTVIAEMVYI